MLLLILFIVGAGRAWAVSAGDTFVRISSASDLSDGDEIIFVNQAESHACGTTQNENNRTPVPISVSGHSYTYASKDKVQVFVVKINTYGKYGFHTGSGYIYSASSENNYLKTNSTAISTSPGTTSAWSLSVDNYVCTVTNSKNTSYYLAFYGTGYFSQYKTSQSKPYIYKKQVVTSVYINAACTDGKGKYYGTYSNSSAFVVPEGLTVSEIAVNGNALVLEDYATGAIVPANTGVIVSATTAGDKTVVLSNEAGTSVLGDDNALRPTGDGITAAQMSEADANSLYYRLTMHNGTELGFWWGAENGAAFEIAANKAYLVAPTGAGVKGFNFFDNETAIKQVSGETEEEQATFNLMGQRVNANTRGIVVRNGKKFIDK